MKALFVKVFSIFLILTFASCMTIAPDNRSMAVEELTKASKAAVSRVPLENPSGPVYRIGATSNNMALMIAGQTALEQGYKYFHILDSGSSQSISGYMYQGYGSISTNTTYNIAVIFTNDESETIKYNAYECSTLIDGYKFLTQKGSITFWTLFGTTFAAGTAMMFYPLIADTASDNIFISGLCLTLGSPIFTIPIFFGN